MVEELFLAADLAISIEPVLPDYLQKLLLHLTRVFLANLRLTQSLSPFARNPVKDRVGSYSHSLIRLTL